MAEKTIHVAIGNSDDKLSQRDWFNFYSRVDLIVVSFSSHIFGRWVSAATSPYQNACWALTVDNSWARDDFRLELGRAAAEYGQDAISWNESESEMLKPIGTVRSWN